ncbi:hypothetical protein FH972_018091 [Carpinus fangiana]|uniref:Protein kinase domain-containing protein n=1 Tax=Carpinus fangiana TaxID=176857 RepID=A0A5N6RPA8_9ROSI|nr:hypothetical protein FH972_018091 [Carpinus fangiana]
MPTKAKPGCPSHCGDVEIPFPFGLSVDCFLDESFYITCQSGKPFTGNVPVRNISIDTHELHVLNYVARDCPTDGSKNRTSLRVPQYTISNSKNKFTGIGCDTIAYLSGYQNGEEYKIGCSSQCPTPNNVGTGFCSGVGCCEVRFPYGLRNISVEVESFNNHASVQRFNPCGYAFVVEKGQFNFSASYLQNYTNEMVPLVLDWAVMSNLTCEEARHKPNFACKDINSECIDNQTRPAGYSCQCKQGYRGNPYLHGGCDDIDECLDGTHNCTEQCTNGIGNYTCGNCPSWRRGNGKKDSEGCSVDPKLPILASIGIAIGLTSMLGGSWWLYLEFQSKISIKLKARMSIKLEAKLKEGGSKLEQHLGQQGSTPKNAKIFTYEELKEATNNYHEESRIIGKGGFGTVYKGSLPNNTIVAIKKTNIVDPDQVDQFINEIIQLSKIDHKNVVKLLGWCLKTEALLVYEFVPKGTLFDYIRNESNTSNKQREWETRLRIATETAGALSYLHFTASPPIIHRDVKPSNILLDDNFIAKVSNFGISKSIPQDQKELATAVHGTSEYLDPEYEKTKLLTKKSDVYSFGVVLIDLLTVWGVLESTMSKNGKTKAKNFLSSLEENRLPDILDDRIDEKGNKEQIKKVVKLAEMCLRLKGDERPTMEELRKELEGIRKTKKHSSVNAQSNLEELE